MRFLAVATMVVALMVPWSVRADGVESLKAFFKSTSAMRAHFRQVVTDAQGNKVQEVEGHMQLQRPGKFRWDYNKPYVQQIVGDGEKVWLYDPDLNQLTVRPMSKAIGSSPASLLAGAQDAERNFTLTTVIRSDGLAWAQAVPKAEDSGFDKVLLGFKGDELQKMELHDSFGHVTSIQFSQLQRNPAIANSSFQFVVPAGADVVGE
ncbi:outer membrane lipoprotein chaperone LolA [Methylobacillus flagellatus]|uniref:Outer-membrane lipoprotein carrier protein n=1 Tax=Methylobacillus flagellatus (strain ATCC 51484 / DSM 6875 / VKM B-1610 / KT) TaxID=265072 RepID=LOLA_METFK|nr:outer membrane lipoprotein chaperone LolA [Methylobacillus flagellatus]Q1H294.1 RecName: Full=Outer-membrane lipoprotein carrier protein; Flags: Precursor [Methylobacillus flagellatus KT]ABE49393.1 outer membrane lipoprotein carrier protein LolA [Methylobacillus flagellatus KT]